MTMAPFGSLNSGKAKVHVNIQNESNFQNSQFIIHIQTHIQYILSPTCLFCFPLLPPNNHEKATPRCRRLCGGASTQAGRDRKAFIETSLTAAFERGRPRVDPWTFRKKKWFSNFFKRLVPPRKLRWPLKIG